MWNGGNASNQFQGLCMDSHFSLSRGQDDDQVLSVALCQICENDRKVRYRISHTSNISQELSSQWVSDTSGKVVWLQWYSRKVIVHCLQIFRISSTFNQQESAAGYPADAKERSHSRGLRWMMPNQTLLQRRQTLGLYLLEGKMNLSCTSLNLLISSPNALLTTSHVIQITWTSTIDWIPKKTPGQEEIGSRNRRQGLAVQTLFELLSNSAFSARGVQFVCKRLPARSVADMFCWPFSPALGHACLRRCANEAADSSPFESDIAIFCLWRNTWQGCQEGHRGWFAVLISAQFVMPRRPRAVRKKQFLVTLSIRQYPIIPSPSEFEPLGLQPRLQRGTSSAKFRGKG